MQKEVELTKSSSVNNLLSELVMDKPLKKQRRAKPKEEQ
jgi:hypothetical protein